MKSKNRKRGVDMSPFDRRDLTDSNNQFALDVYARLSQTHSSNLFFSPFSIASALAMTWAGARGETEQEMAEVLHIPSGDETVHRGYSSLMRQIFQEGEGGCELSVANRIWGQQGYEFRTEFLALLREHYDVQPETLDFVVSPESSRQRINQWVGERTAGRIPELIPEREINELTRLILTNAIYFKGQWAESFDKAETEDAPFHLSRFRKNPVKMMHQVKPVLYAKVKGVQILELLYVEEELSLVILLPRRVGKLQKLERQLSSATLNQWLSEVRRKPVSVYLPRFRATTDYRLSKVLQSLGMVKAFSLKAADFSGMTEATPGLSISEAFHKAFMKTNEEGSEAAAATAIVMEVTSALLPSREPKVPVFRADHPFVFMIRHRQSGIILFMGRITDPQA